MESILHFADLDGLTMLAKLSSHYDNTVKKRACIALAKTLKIDKTQVMAKETGVIAVLATQLSSPESVVSSSCAFAIAALAHNDANLAELLKMGTLEILIRHLQAEDKDPKRESMSAFASFSENGIHKYLTNLAKFRVKVRNSLEYVQLIVKILGSDDAATVVHACDCIIALSEDGQSDKINIISGFQS